MSASSKNISNISYADFNESMAGKASKKRIPLFGQWELTFHCNLNCVHCYVVKNPDKQELSFQEITNILDQLHEAGCFWLGLTGGEPLMRPDFLEIYTYAKKKGFLLNIFTNGTLITSKIADYFEKYPPFMVEISVYGIIAQTYERIAKIPGSFDQYQRGIELLLERGLPLTLKTPGMTLNRDEILKIKEWTGGLEKAKYKYSPIITPRLDGTLKPCELRLSPDEIIDIEATDETMLEEWRSYLQCEHKLSDGDDLFPCGAGFTSFNISPYGELQLCQFLQNAKFDLSKVSFREAFYQLFPKIYSAHFQTNSKCKDCQVRYLCPQCPARALLETGDQEKPVEYFCHLAHKRQKVERALVG